MKTSWLIPCGSLLSTVLSAFLLTGCTTSNQPSNLPITQGTSGKSEIPVGKEESYIQQASNLLLPKSIKKANFKILQSMATGSLCIRGEYNYQLSKWFYTGDIFYWVDSSNATIADEDIFHGDMYWCGTYTYTTVKKVERTVHVYTTKYDLAIQLVRKQFNLYDPPDQGANTNTPPTSETTASSAQPILVGCGTGFFVTTDGYLLTCLHVIKKGHSYSVLSNSGVVKAASLVGFDEVMDLALLKVDCVSQPLNFGSIDNIRLGEAVFTIGFPSPEIQGLAPKVTKGIVSSLTGANDDVKSLQIDAAVQPGNSGGPLLTETGRVIGVVNARADDVLYATATGSPAQNVNYAAKREFVIAFLQSQADVWAKLQRIGSPAKTAEDAINNATPSVVLVAAFATE